MHVGRRTGETDDTRNTRNSHQHEHLMHATNNTRKTAAVQCHVVENDDRGDCGDFDGANASDGAT